MINKNNKIENNTFRRLKSLEIKLSITSDDFFFGFKSFKINQNKHFNNEIKN